MEFTKDMLRTGMRVVHRNGDVGIVLKDIKCIAEQDGFCNLANYSESLSYHNSDRRITSKWDIVKVYEGFTLDNRILDFKSFGCLIWERKEETEQQKQIRELEETIKKAQEQIENLHKLS